MKLLIITQTVDTEDPVMGFFVRWIEELAKHTESIDVICLKVGKSDFPKNVRVHSLGKEQGVSRLKYIVNFYTYIWRLRHEYDAVFVHMNQEYVLLGGWLWKLSGKRVYMWRNHYAGSWLTDIAAAFCTKVFCTSKHSYTAKYKKTILMPVGVDTERFHPDEHIVRKPHSVLLYGRISPSKRPEMFIDALALLAHKKIEFTADLYGSPLPQDEKYYEGLKEKVHSLGLENRISFHPGPPNYQAPDIYRAHEIFVNTSPPGMLDKTIFEAAASGCFVLAASKDFAAIAGPDSYFDSATDLARCLTSALANPSVRSLSVLVAQNSLTSLGERVSAVLAASEHPRRLRALVWRTLAVFARVIPHTPRMTVLFYHSISDSPDFFAVPPDRFEKQMQYLRKHFDVVSLSRAFAHAAGERVKRDSVAVTVDDGYRDFVTEALPILKRHDIPSTVFIIGGTPSAGELGNDHFLLEVGDAGALVDPLVSVGSHTQTHKKLTKIPPEEALQEMQESRTTIESTFGVPVRYLSYPKGSYNQSVMQRAKVAGYAGAVTVVERGIRAGDDPYALPRIQVDSSTTTSIFNAKLTSAADWYYALWSLLAHRK